MLPAEEVIAKTMWEATATGQYIGWALTPSKLREIQIKAARWVIAKLQDEGYLVVPKSRVKEG